MEEYNLIISQRHYKLIKAGAKKATVTFKEGDMLQQRIGWMVLNRDCKITVHNADAVVTRVISSR